MDKNLKLGLIVGVIFLGLIVVFIILQHKNQSEVSEGDNLAPDEEVQTVNKAKDDNEVNLPDIKEGVDVVSTVSDQESSFNDLGEDSISKTNRDVNTIKGISASRSNADQDNTIIVEETDTKLDDDATIRGEIGSLTEKGGIKTDIPSNFIPSGDTSHKTTEEGTEGTELKPLGKVNQESEEIEKREPKEAKVNTYVVKRGDSLYGIAREVYGDGGKWRIIYKANKDILQNPDNLRPKQELKIPPLTQPSTNSSTHVTAPSRSDSTGSPFLGEKEKQVMFASPQSSGHKTHRVKKGENLSKIALIYYRDRNKWPQIFRANAGRIVNKDRLIPGQEIIIP